MRRLGSELPAMSTDNIPFTPETLAARWQCSAQHIRDLINRKKLRCFRVGRLYRIPYDAVIDIENGEAAEVAKPTNPPDVRVVSVPQPL
ncbi:excisionase family DNA-binding protein [Brucella cytisi]|uniref:excisionase family DNA-binding protein n=1 Tax=Brucella cytisi TaxID=407152 RepID=UPI000A03C2C1